MAEIRTFGDAIAQFDEHYLAWRNRKEVWPMNVYLATIKATDKTKAFLVIGKLNKIITDNTYAEVLEAYKPFSVEDWTSDVGVVTREAKRPLVSKLETLSIFRDYNKVSYTLNHLTFAFRGLTRSDARNKPYWLFYASCEIIYNTLYHYFRNQ